MLMPEIRKRQDYGLWLNILKTGVIGYGIQQPLAIYRIRESSLSNKKNECVEIQLDIIAQTSKFIAVQCSVLFQLFSFQQNN